MALTLALTLSSQSRGCRELRRAESPSTLYWLALACTTARAVDSARATSPSFDVTATVMFLPGMNTTSAYHIVFDPLCQYTLCGISVGGAKLYPPIDRPTHREVNHLTMLFIVRSRMASKSLVDVSRSVMIT